MAQKADVVLYGISTKMSKIESDGDKVLRYFTAETGGRSFFPFKVEDLEQPLRTSLTNFDTSTTSRTGTEPLKTDGLFHTGRSARKRP
jgi:Ca-activated chloride channel homolog